MRRGASLGRGSWVSDLLLFSATPGETGLREIPVTFIGSIYPLQPGLSKTAPLRVRILFFSPSPFSYLLAASRAAEKVNVGNSTTIEHKAAAGSTLLEYLGDSPAGSLFLTLGEGPIRT